MATANGFGTDASFTLLKLIHSNLTFLSSSNENKHEIMDLNRVPYAVRFNKELANIFVVADENGFVKLFRTYPCLKPVKEFHVNKSCIYDLQWLNSHQIACGGGDKYVCVYDLNVGEQISRLKGHTESVKSISQVPENPFVLASGARDGSVLIYDLRCNKSQSHAVSAIAADGGDESNFSVIKPVNTIAKAHYDLNHTATGTSAVSTRLAKASPAGHHMSPSTALLHSQRRASPVACIAYQTETLLVSTGATDGLIKVWDTRKIYTPSQTASSSSKRSSAAHLHEPIPPVYTFSAPAALSSSSDATPSAASSSSRSSSKTSFSNVLFNHARTRLYANCMNNSIYEYNFCTYLPKHTRTLNSPSCDEKLGKLVKPHHLNQSNYIKASLSMCDNFLLTGSSDSNAYIYATHTNANLKRFRHHLPVLVLKGHNNEVTAVDWSPIDIDQLVTCSDDNVIRLWSCQRDLEKSMEKMNECCFLQAEVCFDRYDNDPEAPAMSANETAAPPAPPACQRWYDDDSQFVPSLSAMNTARLNNHFPHLYQLGDEFFLKNYDHKNLVCSVRQRLPRPPESRTDIPEPECTAFEASGSQKGAKFKILKNLSANPFADLPINIIEPDSDQTTTGDAVEMREAPVKPKLSWPLALLSSGSRSVKNPEGKPPKPISINKKAKAPVDSAQTGPEGATDSPKVSRRQPRGQPATDSIKKSASKKRAHAATAFLNMSDLKTPLSIIENSSQVAESSRVSSPKSKKRLVMSEPLDDAENSNEALPLSTSSKTKAASKRDPRGILQAKAANTLSPSTSTRLTGTPTAAKNSILNYFSKN